MNSIKSFTIYREYYELISILPQKEQANLYLAIIQYIFEDIEPNLTKQSQAVFTNLKRPLDKSKSKSNNSSKSNQNKNKTKTKQNQNEIKNETHQDVYVNVNNHDNDYVVNVDVNNNLFSFIESNFNRTLNSIEYEIIITWEDNELTRYAIKQAVLNQAYSVKYINAILESYKQKGISSVVEAQKADKEFQAKKKNKSTYQIKEEEPAWFDKEVEDDEILSEEEIAKLEGGIK